MTPPPPYRGDSSVAVALMQAEARYRFLAEGPVPVWDWDLVQGPAWWNDALLELVGLSREQFDPLSAHLYFHPDDMPAMDAAKERHFSGAAEVFEVEHRMRHADGHYITVLTRAKATFDPDGRPTRMVGTVLDLTSMRDAAAREDRHRFDLDSVGVGVWELDTRSGRLECSPRLHELAGHDRSTPLDAAFVLDRLHPDDRAVVKRGFARLAEGVDAARPVECQVRFWRDAVGWCRLTARAISDRRDDGSVWMHGVVQDVTALHRGDGEHRRLERDLRDALHHALALATSHAESASPRHGRAGDQDLCDELVGRLRELQDRLGMIGAPADVGAPVIDSMLDNLAAEFEFEHGISIRAWPGPAWLSGALQPFEREVLFFVLRETLHDIGRRAQACRVTVGFEGDAAIGVAVLTIADDDVGVTADAPTDTDGYGLPRMRERVSAVGGHLQIRLKRGRGRRVRVRVPVATSALGTSPPGAP